MLYRKLDKGKIAEMLLKLPLISLQLGHKKVSYSLRDYIIPTEEKLEAQFIRDLFVLPTDQIIDKWFDGEASAGDLIVTMQKISQD